MQLSSAISIKLFNYGVGIIHIHVRLIQLNGSNE